MHTYICHYSGVCLSSREFLSGDFVGVLSERFCPGWFCSSPPFCQNTFITTERYTSLSISGFICMIFFKVRRRMLLDPLPLSQTVTPSRTPSPSSLTHFMGGALRKHE